MRRFFLATILAPVIIVLTSATGLATTTLYGGIGRGSAQNAGYLITIDQTNGSGTVVGHPDSVPGLSGLAFDLTGALYGSTISGPPGSGTSNLVRINPDTGAQIYSVPITLSGVPVGVNDLAVQPGTNILFGTIATNEVTTLLVMIDKITGVATLRAVINNAGGAIAFAPNGTLYETSTNFANGTGFLNTIDPQTGAILTSNATDEFYGGLAVRADGVIFASGGMEGDIDILNPDGTSVGLGSTGVGGVGDLDFRSMTAFTACLQDDSNGNILFYNATTGDYLFTNCHGVALSGTAQVLSKGSYITLQQYGTDRYLLVKIDGAQHKGTASLRLLSNGTTFSIIDRDTTNDTCVCGG
ncbi:MAG TPA: hypothetical protein VKA60_05880 [Blastocatellia bacterium]|nr:hypothetical protein [Blastocatellia bacterium]